MVAAHIPAIAWYSNFTTTGGTVTAHIRPSLHAPTAEWSEDGLYVMLRIPSHVNAQFGDAKFVSDYKFQLVVESEMETLE